MTLNPYMKAMYDRRKAAKCCVRCGSKDERTLQGLTMCEKCALRQKRISLKSYYQKKKTAQSGNSETV